MLTGRTDPPGPVPGKDSPDANEDGSAAVEFVFLGVLLLIPLVYLILTAGQVQGAAYAMVGAAEHAAKVYAPQLLLETGRRARHARQRNLRLRISDSTRMPLSCRLRAARNAGLPDRP